MFLKTLSRFDFDDFNAMLNYYIDCTRDHTILINTEFAFDQNGNLIDSNIDLSKPNPRIRYIVFFYDSL